MNMKKLVFSNFPLGKIKSLLMALLVVMSVLPFTGAEESTVESCVISEEAKEESVKCVPYEPKIDVVFVIDSTGSMADEIRTVKTHLIKIIREVEDGQPRPDLRIGVVTYRDHEAEEREYLYKKLELTRNIESAVNFIRNIESRGGGDLPEAVADGLDFAINQMNWNNEVIQQNQKIYPYPYTKKLIFLIGDAPPHGEGSTDQSYIQGCPNGHNYRQNIDDANKRGIRIYTVSGSGIDSVGVRIFKEIARKTHGSYTHLNYIRKDVEEYYQEEGFTPAEVQEYVEEAKAYADYDVKTNSILTNTLGVFAKSSMQAEAMEMGVKYDEEDNKPNDDWLDTDDITGDVIVEIEEEEEIAKKDLYGFFKRIFDKVIFWR